MYKCCLAIMLCACCSSCSPRPGSSFGFADGKPIHVIREDSREESLLAAERRCQGSFSVLEEGRRERHRGGWAEPARAAAGEIYFMRVKCDSH